jgi:hypothetical protein
MKSNWLPLWVSGSDHPWPVPMYAPPFHVRRGSSAILVERGGIDVERELRKSDEHQDTQ